MENFNIRSYSKKELALLYFPDSSPEIAVKHLMNWVKRCSTLVDELKSRHYVATNKSFTSHQVALIVDYLGEP
ncbi:MAG: DUF4248 domain-containing protein [Bacteroidaceae bacterium]|nr:DUF4248 domain-containing protein [Bacteroidaceae bacterium]